jgi:cation diffusion facilitator family transporter
MADSGLPMADRVPSRASAPLPPSRTIPVGHTRSQAVRRMLWIVLALNLGVTLVKLAVGLASGSLSVIADAFQSIVDASSNVIGLLGMWIGARPPDENHPYGHHKYETIAAMGIGAMLLAAGYEIGRGAVGRFVGASPALHITPLTFGLIGFTFFVNLGIVFYETRAGRRLQSDILLADAAQTRTNLFLTISVLGSLAGTRLGWAWLDPAVALVILGFLFRAAFDILLSTSQVLTDVAVADPGEVERVARGVPGVTQVSDVRSRGRADAVYIDLHVKVNPAMDTDQAHGVASEVEYRISTAMPNVVEALVHIEPGRTEAAPTSWEALYLMLRSLADGLGLGLHDFHAHAEHDGRYAVELHLEVDAGLTLGEAHVRADEFETRVRETLPEVASIVTHIEPLPAEVPDEENGIMRGGILRERIAALANRLAGPGACHNVELHNLNGHLTATLHVTQSAEKPLTEAHALAETIERELHAHERLLHRVVVHVEPPD